MPVFKAGLFKVTLFSALFGLSSVTITEIVWVETARQACSTVCQKTDYQFAVPGGIHPPTQKWFCATNMVGWQIGFNIEWEVAKGWCQAQCRKWCSRFCSATLFFDDSPFNICEKFFRRQSGIIFPEKRF
jgi:hypothetical protein